MDSRNVEETYKQYTQYEHILNRPDTYVGSLEFQKDTLWVYNAEEDKLEQREVRYVPGLFKIFDEIIVNAADNFQRDQSMKYIKVDIDPEKNEISIKNGGMGIPIEIHKVYNIYVPELIFGNLLTSSNYNDNIKKVTGGRNGYGAKLTNIFSKKFIVETADKKQRKIYRQVFSNNMLNKEDPVIKSYNREDFTCVTFEPDLKKFNMDKLDEDILSLFRKRVYDMAGITPSSVEVYLNGKKLEVKNFSSYIDKYLYSDMDEDEEEPVKVFESPDPRWEIGVSLSESQFQQVSFVNSISTSKGGTHVNYVTEKIVNAILVETQKKNKTYSIKPQHVKQHLWVFVNCLIENSTFDSQTKETLTSKRESFGSSFEFSDKFLKKVIKCGIVERCLRFAQTREEEKAMRQMNIGKGKKQGRVIGIDKLDDANEAGKRESAKCVLILTEGDSAKSLAMAGIETVGRDYYGCFPLRGKMLNVREANPKQLSKNQEVQNLMRIIGLKYGETYTDVRSLRYGGIMIMTDQDVDGSHIKGLIINFIHHLWPSLVKLNGFIKEFITPILKASKDSRTYAFYSIPEYKKWVNEVMRGNIKGWKIKYYKGLGTSSNKEAKEYFGEIEEHRIDFKYENEKDDESIDLAFNKKKTEQRKNWLMQFDPNTPPLTLKNTKSLSYDTFINRELILFSMYDNQRSIPSLCDGLKPSERKILYGCFKRNLKDEIKVAQLVGYIGEHSAYHHGETSLAGTIVAMAQNFVGSNNINLLLPLGQFGSRNQGGKDSASSRYIFTNLNKVTRHIFNANDLPLMDYIVEEGQKIEPKWYIPIIPLILVNGTEGIGTGWSTDVPCFNPRDIVNSLKNKILYGKFIEFDPWYKGYTGIIEKGKKPGTYTVNGKYYWSEEDENSMFITELPIKKWTKDYKNLLEELMGAEIVKESEKKDGKKKRKAKEDDDTKEKKKKIVILEDFKQNHSNNRINFEVKFLPEFTQEYKENPEKVIKTFKLQTSIPLTNMVLFDPSGKLKRYPSVESIMEEFYNVRLQFYEQRREYMLSSLKREVAILDNKVRFILAVANDELIIRKVKKADLIARLVKDGYTPMSKLNKIQMKTQSEKLAEEEVINNQSVEDDEETENDSRIEGQNGKVPAKEYDYLLSMPLWNLTYERVEELEKQKKMKEEEYKNLYQTKPTQLWLSDMDNFIKALEEYEEEEENERKKTDGIRREGKKEGKGKRKGRKKKEDNNNKTKEPKKEGKKEKIEVKDNNIIITNDKGKDKVNGLEMLMSSMKGKNKGKENKQEENENKEKENEEKKYIDDVFTLPWTERLKMKKQNVPVADPALNYHDKNYKRKNNDMDDIESLIDGKNKKVLKDEDKEG